MIVFSPRDIMGILITIVVLIVLYTIGDLLLVLLGGLSLLALGGIIIHQFKMATYYDMRKKEGTADLSNSAFAQLIADQANSKFQESLDYAPNVHLSYQGEVEGTPPNIRAFSFRLDGDSFDAAQSVLGRTYGIIIEADRKKVGGVKVSLMKSADTNTTIWSATSGSVDDLINPLQSKVSSVFLQVGELVAKAETARNRSFDGEEVRTYLGKEIRKKNGLHYIDGKPYSTLGKAKAAIKANQHSGAAAS